MVIDGNDHGDNQHKDSSITKVSPNRNNLGKIKNLKKIDQKPLPQQKQPSINQPKVSHEQAKDGTDKPQNTDKPQEIDNVSENLTDNGHTMSEIIDNTIEITGDGKVDSSMKRDLKNELKRNIIESDGKLELIELNKEELDKIKLESDVSNIPILLTIEDTNFLLMQTDGLSPTLSKLVALYDESILDYTITKLFQLIRTDEDLVELHELNERDEMVLEVPDLDINISEDNIYAREITVSDFLVIFKELKTEGNLQFILSHKPRFITRFNDLNDLIRDRFESKRRKIQY